MEANERVTGASMPLGSALRAVHRLEVGPMYVVAFVWALLLGAGTVTGLATVPNVLTLIINGLLLFGGFALNSWADYPIDSRSKIKGHVARAVETLSRRTVLLVFFAETLLATVLAAVVAAQVGSAAFFVVAVLGILSGVLYNAEPARLKRRGLWNPAMMAVRFGFVPGFLAYVAAAGSEIPKGVWLLLAGMALVSFSRGFWNSVSDTHEDAAVGIRTPAVAHGPAATTRSAVVFLGLGCALVLWGFWALLGPLWALVGASGLIVAFVGRFVLASRARSDDQAVQLLSAPSVRGADNKMSLASYYLFLVPCLYVLLT